MVGGVTGSYPCDKIGRKWMILVVQIVMIGGCILEQLATHWTHWLGARLLDVSAQSALARTAGWMMLRCIYLWAASILESIWLTWSSTGLFHRSRSVLYQRVHLRDGSDCRPRCLSELGTTVLRDRILPLWRQLEHRHESSARKLAQCSLITILCRRVGHHLLVLHS